jgi:hypothetical protein
VVDGGWLFQSLGFFLLLYSNNHDRYLTLLPPIIHDPLLSHPVRLFYSVFQSESVLLYVPERFFQRVSRSFGSFPDRNECGACVVHVPFIKYPRRFFRVVPRCLLVCSRVYDAAHSRNKGEHAAAVTIARLVHCAQWKW